jgi:hypothetical protein
MGKGELGVVHRVVGAVNEMVGVLKGALDAAISHIVHDVNTGYSRER